MPVNLKNQSELINTIQRAIPDPDTQTIVCRAVQEYYKKLFDVHALKPQDVLMTPVTDESGKKIESKQKKFTVEQIAEIVQLLAPYENPYTLEQKEKDRIFKVICDQLNTKEKTNG